MQPSVPCATNLARSLQIPLRLPAQNIHNARTAKKAVPFVGQREAGSSRWTFQLNPSLSWADMSPESRQRLQHLPQEAAQAFRRQAQMGRFAVL